MTKSTYYTDENGKIFRTMCNTETATKLGRLKDVEALNDVSNKAYKKFVSQNPTLTMYRTSTKKYFIHVETEADEDIVPVTDPNLAFVIMNEYIVQDEQPKAEGIKKTYVLTQRTAHFVAALAQENGIDESFALDFLISEYIKRNYNGDDLSAVALKGEKSE